MELTVLLSPSLSFYLLANFKIDGFTIIIAKVGPTQGRTRQLLAKEILGTPVACHLYKTILLGGFARCRGRDTTDCAL